MSPIIKNGHAPASPKRPSSPSTTPNMALGLAIQIARKYLFLDTRRKAIAYFVLVGVLSIIPSFITLSEDHYWVQKHNIFNQYGTKMGWFWTLIIVGPFIWYSSKMHHRNNDRVFIDIMRLFVATFLWYVCTNGFHKFSQLTSRCDKSVKWNRSQCSENGGTWVPGFDISGHCFLLIYSILIICEESSSFRQWSQLKCGNSEREKNEFKLNVHIVQGTFVAMLVLHLFWDVQLVISVLYYHIFIDKVLGAVFAIGCWFITYHMLFPSGFLASPISRKKK